MVTDQGSSDWSDPLTLEAGLLAPNDWHGSAITLPDDPGRAQSAPAPLLRTEFTLDQQPVRARLYVTSLGVHALYLNGEPVGDGYLAPGWTTYRERLVADAFDVTARLRPGRNAIGAILGDGWYRGRLGWKPGEDRCRYGEDVGLLLQLEVELTDGSRVEICSDETWRATTAEIRSADLYDGAAVDLREARPGWQLAGHDDSGWQTAISVPLDRQIIEPRATPPVRSIDVREVQVERDANGRVLLDAGQNLAGFVRLQVRGTAGDRVRVRHAEVLEADGALHTQALRSALATDEYTLAGSETVTLEPPFTFHGFRYAEVETDAEVLGAEVVAISSDLPRRSTFSCSDERLNKLHENVLWSLRGNFVSLPTDCPQRDERLGWTGDAQAFAPTACTLVESDAFWLSWLRDLDLDQDDELGVPSVVPGRRPRWRGALRARRLGRRRHDRPMGRVRVVRRPRDPAPAVPEHAPLGAVARAATRPGRPARALVAVRGLAGPGCTARSAVGGQVRLRLHRQCVLLLERSTARRCREGHRRTCGERRVRGAR